MTYPSSYGTGALPPITWLELSTEDLGRWTWGAKLSWPFPLTSSGVGSWEPDIEEFMGTEPVPEVRRTRGEERLLETLAEVLAQPGYCAYVIRGVGDLDSPEYVENYYAAIVRDDEAVVVVDEPGTGTVRVGRTHPTTIAAAIAGQLPKLQAAPIRRVTLPARTVELLTAGFTRGGTPERTLRSALASAGVPEVTAERLFADPKTALAVGSVGAIGYTASSTDASASKRGASWTEMSDGGMISVQNRAGEVTWEPLSIGIVNRAIADALTGIA